MLICHLLLFYFIKIFLNFFFKCLQKSNRPEGEVELLLIIDNSSSVQSFICLFVHLFICSSVLLFICSFVYMFVCTSIHLCIYSSVHLFICLFVYLLICSFLHLLICLYVSWFICWFVYMFVCASIRLFICSSVPSSSHIKQKSKETVCQTLLSDDPNCNLSNRKFTKKNYIFKSKTDSQ